MASKVGVSPATGLLCVSIKVIVMVEVVDPSAVTGPLPVIDEFAAMAPPETKETVPPVFEIGDVMESVFASAVLELRVQVEIPEAFEAEQVP